MASENGHPIATGGPDVDGPLRVGQQVGHYRVVRRLASGGMGVIYVAQDNLNRAVVLKVLAPVLASDARQRVRLRLEAEAMARLHHPAIATVHAFEEIDGLSFLVSDFVTGLDLRQRLRSQGPYAPRDVVDLALQIAEALAVAHQAGIVHRDLKPENIMLPEEGGVKLLDFGLARFEPAGQETRQGLTETGVVLGTPSYMSPEQLQGACVDHRSDIFSLGVLLYELATGANPFAGRTTATTILNVLQLDPPPLSSRRPLMFGPLEAIVRRCLAKAPEARYGSVAALIEDLKVARQQWESQAQPATEVTPASSAFRWWQFHQVAVTVVNAVMLVPLWFVRERMPPAPLRDAIFFGCLGLVVLSAVARTSTAFLTARHWLAEPTAARRRLGVAVADFLLAMVAAFGAWQVLADKPGLAALVWALALGLLLILFIVEPVTTRAALSSVTPEAAAPASSRAVR